MSEYIELVPLIQPHVADAPLPMILDAVRRATTRFCEESDAYRAELQPIPAIANVAFYDLPVPIGTSLVRIVAGTYQGAVMQPVSTVLRVDMPQNTGPLAYQQVGSRVRIQGKPESTVLDAFVFEVSLRPGFASTGVDTAVFEAHGDSIFQGALSYLLAQPGQIWSNPAMANFYEGMFREAILIAKRRANNDDTAKERICAYGGL